MKHVRGARGERKARGRTTKLADNLVNLFNGLGYGRKVTRQVSGL
jgi:hypothetical protein